ncbi:MAG TPA: hypothetical protein VFU28_02460 [Vicinamibacterales bacterium]|nr:hypothetical protein [Vicinamibacterales bacterium]
MRAASIQQTEWWKDNMSRAAREAERLMDLGKGAVRMKVTIAERIEDDVNKARRAVKHGYRAAEDFVEDTTHRIKREPLRSVGVIFIAGMALGWLLPRVRQ